MKTISKASILRWIHDVLIMTYLKTVLDFAMVGGGALMFWSLMKLLCHNDSPGVVVLSGSMEPGFHRGDLLFLYGRTNVQLGDVVVYNSAMAHGIPIVHRVLDVHEEFNENGDLINKYLLTKGDNNQMFDHSLYAKGTEYITENEVLGIARGFFPLLGYVTIIFGEHPWMKFVLFGFALVSILLGQE